MRDSDHLGSQTFAPHEVGLDILSPDWETGQGSRVFARGARCSADRAGWDGGSIGVKRIPPPRLSRPADSSQNSPDSLRMLSRPVNTR